MPASVPPHLLPILILVVGCSKNAAGSGVDAGTVPSATSSASAALSSQPATSAAPSASAASADPPADTHGCADGMVRVEGEYCPALTQQCVEHHKEYESNKDDKNVSERCLRYADPSHCVSKDRRHLAFCVDRYEWPNQKGELPRVLTSWHEAKKACEGAGKRLCTEDEFNFACEGPQMLPYVNGFVRDKTKCNIDQDYRYPDHSRRLPQYDECLTKPWCATELQRLDQRRKIGETEGCVSWAGVVDMNGNVNEWVELPGQEPPNRSGLKGGWWGPVRSRCRPTVTFHKESDYGYEAGFRCCKAATDGAAAAPSASAPPQNLAPAPGAVRP